MGQHLAMLSLLVHDYDEAIAFFTQKLHFTLEEDTVLSATKRWVVVSPSGKEGCKLLLAKAVGAAQELAVGNQTGGRVFLFLHTSDFEKDYQNLLQQHIKIIRGPVAEPYGTVCVFEDIWGNWWDLIQPIQQETH